MNAHELKQLKTRKSKIQAEVDSLCIEADRINGLLNTAISTLNSIDDAIKKAESPDKPIIVTEHALLRYLERNYSLDLNELAETIRSKVMKMNGKYPLGNGLKAVVRGGSVVTVE